MASGPRYMLSGSQLEEVRRRGKRTGEVLGQAIAKDIASRSPPDEVEGNMKALTAWSMRLARESGIAIPKDVCDRGGAAALCYTVLKL